ncbi:hypothetical protein IMZ11_28050 [Microtetraspora sp. AC03309]|uniref:hypothetical protein n=1 Tax=Microtetraspora sp. AC03309 TaxID=2779376 RepID=UPI001E656FD8|nr:hypothetical protein [Microtetraspora sp. AC03309]MCC5579490.1 hypothetical protein [Microtetraspora sp. AC03309]
MGRIFTFETFESLDHTIQLIAGIPQVSAVNILPAVTRGADPGSRNLRHVPRDSHSAEVRDQMWLFARNTMRALGYVEGPVSSMRRSSRSDRRSDEFEQVVSLGVGISASGYLDGPDWGARYYNARDPRDYAERIGRNRLAIWRLGRLDRTEQVRRTIIAGLANLEVGDLFEIEERYGVSIDALYGRVFNALLELGLIGVDTARRGIRLTEEGLCRLEEITYFLGSDLVRTPAMNRRRRTIPTIARSPCRVGTADGSRPSSANRTRLSCTGSGERVPLPSRPSAGHRTT